MLRAAPAHGLYHCVGSGHATWFEVAPALAERLGVQPVIRGIALDELELRAPRPRFCALSNRKLGRGRGGDAALAGRGGALRRYPDRSPAGNATPRRGSVDAVAGIGYLLLIVIRATGFFQSRIIGMKSPWPLMPLLMTIPPSPMPIAMPGPMASHSG